MNYYNDNSPEACAWMEGLVKEGLIPPGVVECKSITDIDPDALSNYTQCHFFAGIAGWPLALHLAGWPTDRPVWTGSCPCQPFSVAGRGDGTNDERHLWPAFFRLIAACRPATVFGEQVASAAVVGKVAGGDREQVWLDGVCADLEGAGYACGAAVLGAHSAGAPHVRQRLYWVADSAIHGRKGLQPRLEPQVPQDGAPQTLDAWHGFGHPFEDWRVLLAESHVARVDDGVSSTLDIRPRLHAYGNAIVPQVAAEFIKAYLG